MSNTQEQPAQAGQVERRVSQPWMRLDKPWWCRRNQLQKAADEVGASLIIYRRGEYGPSLQRSRLARDEFYQRHVGDALNVAG